MALDSTLLPLTVYGSDLSYFTGKLEMYLRIKGIAYEFRPMTGRDIIPAAERETGTGQFPAVTLADGRWMSDTTPIIAWLEQQQPSPPVIPSDPVQRFFCLLLEDYADEWLWRPAMHYRWYWAEGAHLQSRHLAEELTKGIPAPMFAKRWFLRRRQRSGYTSGDGVTEQNRAQVEQTYLRNLDNLEAIFQQRPYLLGDCPSLADIGFTGPFFRHFSQDPVAAEIMRQRGPAVWEWVTRMWNTRPEAVTGDWLAGVPEDWGPILEDIGRAYLPYVCANVEAIADGKKRFSPTVDGVTYTRARTSHYRVWCLEQSQGAYAELGDAEQASVRALLEQYHCWEPLMRHQNLDSGVNRDVSPPFGCSHKMLVGA